MKNAFIAAVLCVGMLLGTSSVFAEVCSAKTNLTLSPNDPFKAMTAGWFQWLNQSGTASCSGNSTHLHCTKGSAAYDFYYTVNGSQAWVDVYDSNGFRNEAVATLSNGQVSTWVWDGGVNYGHLTYTCQVVDPVTCNWVYGTCD